MMRLFVGLELPDDVRARLSQLCSGVPGAKWVPPENLHLTVRFIGEVDNGHFQDVHEALSQIRAPAFDLSIRGVGHFETKGRARVLWVGVEREPALVHLHDKIESALVRMGLEPEQRKFNAHITLARLRDANLTRVHQFLSRNNLFRARPFKVETFTLFQSFTGRSGALYRPEASYPLDLV